MRSDTTGENKSWFVLVLLFCVITETN